MVVLFADLPRIVPTPPSQLERLVIAGAAVVSGLFVGAPLILSGQLVMVFLDQRRFLAQIRSLLRAQREERRY